MMEAMYRSDAKEQPHSYDPLDFVPPVLCLDGTVSACLPLNPLWGSSDTASPSLPGQTHNTLVLLSLLQNEHKRAYKWIWYGYVLCWFAGRAGACFVPHHTPG